MALQTSKTGGVPKLREAAIISCSYLGTENLASKNGEIIRGSLFPCLQHCLIIFHDLYSQYGVGHKFCRRGKVCGYTDIDA
jgi:hypothetical protein